MAHPSRRTALFAAATLALGASLPLAASAQAWPSKPVTLVVGSSAGSAPDIYARVLAEQLTRQTGGTFVVENRSGANGNIAIDSVLRLPRDGHTLLIGTQSMLTINPAAYDKLRWSPSDLQPVIKGVESPMVLVVHPSVPAKDFAQLRDWIATQKGRASYASFSPGTPSHFLGYQLNERLKGDMVHVPYKGSAPQVSDLIGGQVPLGFTQMAVAVPQIQAGKLRAIAVTGERRSEPLKNVPTLKEVGLGDLTTSVWFGVFTPTGAPQPVAAAIQAAMDKAHAEPQLREKLQTQNFEMGRESGAAFAQAIAAESARWAAVVKAAGFRAND